MNIMKKLLFLLLSVFTLQVAQADNDKPITFDKLPAKAQTFIKQNFPTEKVAFTKMDIPSDHRPDNASSVPAHPGSSGFRSHHKTDVPHTILPAEHLQVLHSTYAAEPPRAGIA